MDDGEGVAAQFSLMARPVLAAGNESDVQHCKVGSAEVIFGGDPEPAKVSSAPESSPTSCDSNSDGGGSDVDDLDTLRGNSIGSEGA